MIFLDVTSACRLPLLTGIPRTTRALYQLLRGSRHPLEPIVWQPFLHSFTELSPRARTLLEDPAAASDPGQPAPRDDTMPILKACLADLVTGRPRRVALGPRMQSQDTLLLSSIFPDNRLTFLRGLRSRPGRKIAVFHDAVVLTEETSPGWERCLHVAALHVFASMDLVICVSDAAQEQLLALWKQNEVAASRTAALRWPVPFPGPRPPYHEPPLREKKVLYVARLKRVKNHATLFVACELLWREGIKFSLELVGCEDQLGQTRQIQAEIKRLQDQNYSVRWRGHVSDAELHAAYREATITVFPSQKEGFGLPILESLWHGRPVICNDVRPMSDVGRGPGCVLVDAEGPGCLAGAMRKLLMDDALILSMSRDAFGRTLRTWDDYRGDLWAALELES